MKKGNSKRKSVILRVVLLAFSVYVIYLLGSTQFELMSLRREEEALRTEVEERSKKVKEYNNLLKNGDEKDFIEKAAKDKLGFVFPNEQVFVDISGT